MIRLPPQLIQPCKQWLPPRFYTSQVVWNRRISGCHQQSTVFTSVWHPPWDLWILAMKIKSPPPWPGWRWHIRQCCMWHLYWLWDWPLVWVGKLQGWTVAPSETPTGFESMIVRPFLLGVRFDHSHLSQGFVYWLWCPILVSSAMGKRIFASPEKWIVFFPWKRRFQTWRFHVMITPKELGRLRWWQLKYFLIFTPKIWGRWTRFDEFFFK